MSFPASQSLGYALQHTHRKTDMQTYSKVASPGKMIMSSSWIPAFDTRELVIDEGVLCARALASVSSRGGHHGITYPVHGWSISRA